MNEISAHLSSRVASNSAATLAVMCKDNVPRFGMWVKID